MIRALVPTVALCASLLSSSSIEVPAAAPAPLPLAMNCDDNAVNCQIAVMAAAAEDPEHLWLLFAVIREGENYFMALKTPPLARPIARYVLDGEAELFERADRCDDKGCIFGTVLDPTTREFLMAGRTLQIQIMIEGNRVLTIPVDLQNLDALVKRLPVPL
jgi:invasion protein IalB